MMSMLLLLLMLIFAALGTAAVPELPRFRWVPASLALLALWLLLGGLPTWR